MVTNNKAYFTTLKEYKNNKFSFTTMAQNCLEFDENKLKHKRVRTKEEIDYIACLRAKRVVKEYMLCNDFKYFCTLTIKSQDTRFDLDKCKKLLRDCFSYCKKLDKSFKYLCVIEPHEKGGFHFHFCTNLIPFDLIPFTKQDYTFPNTLPYKLIIAIEREKNFYNDFIYHCKYFDNIGWFTCSHIHNKKATSYYILKYISKEFKTSGLVEGESVRRYFCSKGLDRAKSELFINFDFNDVFGEFKHDKEGHIKKYKSGVPIKSIYKNNYMTRVDFDLNELDQEELLKLANIFKINYECNQYSVVFEKIAYILAEKFDNYIFYNLLFK